MCTRYLITVPHALRYITRHHLPVFNLKQVNGDSHRFPPPKSKSHSHYSRDKVRVRKVGQLSIQRNTYLPNIHKILALSTIFYERTSPRFRCILVVKTPIVKTCQRINYHVHYLYSS